MSPTNTNGQRFGLFVLGLLTLMAGLVGFAGLREREAGPSVMTAGEPAPGVPHRAEDPGREICPSTGYLCAGLAEREEPRVLRWADDTRAIRVGVPVPEGVDPARGRALQDAVAAGILAWQDKPFRIEIDRTARSGDLDFTVRWSAVLEGSQLGRTRTRWVREPDGRTGMEVSEFVLVHRDPFERTRPLSPDEVQLVATHEMGHALGLPHSDSDRDVMYPTNTARSLSARDYTTMSALYRLENGVLLRLDPVSTPADG